MIKLKKSKIHGNGIFATKKLRKKQLIDTCPFIFVEHEEDLYMGEIDDYLFGLTPIKSMLVLGTGSIFNHNERANVEYKFDMRKKVVMFFAKRTIQPNEECFIHYGRGYWSSRKIQ